MWEVDPANVYPKGLGSDLIPLQKRLNRIDSLIELAMMANAAGKWLWPTTQSTKPPTGTPTDVIEYDPIGDGKIAPSFVQPSPFHSAVWHLRAAIKQDFQEIGMTEGVQQDTTPQGVTSFRGLAYMGAKGQEQINTPRMLWEMAAKLRYEKCLILARRNWTEERKVAVAGFNGRWGMKQLFGEQLEGRLCDPHRAEQFTAEDLRREGKRIPDAADGGPGGHHRSGRTRVRRRSAEHGRRRHGRPSADPESGTRPGCSDRRADAGDQSIYLDPDLPADLHEVHVDGRV
jgi:hypothetical protein